jgi:DNA invertase Pin-like site-specific DNA recombinase
MVDGKCSLSIGVWCAVSSRAQAGEDKISLEDQERQGREFAAALGGQVTRVYRVPGHTRDLVLWSEAEAQMEAYRELRRDVAEGILDVLWALDVDRLGRDPALGQQVISLVEKSHGPSLPHAEVYLASSPHQVGQKTIASRYISAIQSVRAGEDQARRLHHYRMGMAHRTRRGLPAGGRLPLGYIHQGDEYHFDDQIYAVDLMSRLFLEGRSYLTIARALDDSPHRPPGGGRWNYSVVWRALHRDFYAGVVYWGEVRAESAAIPALWDEATYAAIRRERERRRTGYSTPGSGSLRGVAVCLRCGGPMSRTYQPGDPRPWLRCTRHSKKYLGRPPCHANYLPEEMALVALAKFLAALATPEVLDAALEQSQEAAPLIDLVAELRQVEEQIVRLGEQRRRLALGLAAGDVDRAIYRQADGDLAGRLERVEAHRLTLQADLAARPDREEQRRKLIGLLATIPHRLEGTDPVATTASEAVLRSTALQNAGVRIFCEGGKVAFCGLI